MQPAGVLSVEQQAIHAELIYCIPFATYSINPLDQLPFCGRALCHSNQSRNTRTPLEGSTAVRTL